jgi:hypothetical protein
MEHHKVGTLRCPWCTAVHDCASNVNGTGGPEDGNINICFNCESISIYEREAPGGLRLPTKEEFDDAMEDKDVQKALWALSRSHYLIKKGNN